jgi:hypothetical protein
MVQQQPIGNLVLSMKLWYVDSRLHINRTSLLGVGRFVVEEVPACERSSVFAV